MNINEETAISHNEKLYQMLTDNDNDDDDDDKPKLQMMPTNLYLYK